MKRFPIIASLFTLVFFVAFSTNAAEASANEAPDTYAINMAADSELTTQNLINKPIMSIKKYTVQTPNTGFTGQRYGVQFKDGSGKATEDQAKTLVKHYGYACPDLFPESADRIHADNELEEAKETGTADPDITQETFGDEKVSLIDHNGLMIPHPESKHNTNDELKAFMTANEISFESDDNKPDLNKKISSWADEQLSAEAEESSPQPPSKGDDNETGEGQNDD